MSNDVAYFIPSLLLIHVVGVQLVDDRDIAIVRLIYDDPVNICSSLKMALIARKTSYNSRCHYNNESCVKVSRKIYLRQATNGHVESVVVVVVTVVSVCQRVVAAAHREISRDTNNTEILLYKKIAPQIGRGLI